MASAAVPLVGRQREIDLLGAAVDAAASGRGQVVLVEGEAGIGKTRLVGHVADHARGAGLDVFVGACDDLAHGRPFAALLDALGVRTGSPDPDHADVAALVDTTDPTSLPAGTTNPGLQFRVVEALGALVERLAARGPFLLAVDDLQWADTPSSRPSGSPKPSRSWARQPISTNSSAPIATSPASGPSSAGAVRGRTPGSGASGRPVVGRA